MKHFHKTWELLPHMTALRPRLFSTLLTQQAGWGCARGWEGTQPGPKMSRGIFLTKLSNKSWEQGHSGLWRLSCQATTTHDGVLLSREGMDISLTMKHWMNSLFSSACASSFGSLIKLPFSWPMSFLFFTLPSLSLILLQSGWVAGWCLTCQLGSTHYTVCSKLSETQLKLLFKTLFLVPIVENQSYLTEKSTEVGRGCWLC